MIKSAGICLLLLICLASSIAWAGDPPLEIGSRLELFVDRFLIDRMEGVSLKLHEPKPGEAVLKFDRPWEGRHVGYVTVFSDGNLFRMYYRGLPTAGADGSDAETTCYVESQDGIHWTKPNLGLFELNGSRENNVILAGMAPFSHNFSPFLDSRPGVQEAERYKALAGTSETGLVAFVSPDGLRWNKMREEAVIKKGAFDSQNVAFWSESEGCYVSFFRTFFEGFRSISRATSTDFLNWSEPVEMSFGGTPREHLYTNQTVPYFRAPHVYIALAARFMPGRRVVPAEMASKLGGAVEYSGDCSDTVFLTSRGGERYDRTFMEGFVRPGIGLENWTSRTNYPARGIIPAGSNEVAFYVQRRYGQDDHYLQRLTLRTDGFVSVNAPYQGGECVTKPIRFKGNRLLLNSATSAAGGIKVEIQDEADQPIAGFSLEEADEIVGDEIERTVSWKGQTDVGRLAGKPVRLRFVMKDADVYALRFR
jgi:hypothetical protein